MPSGFHPTPARAVPEIRVGLLGYNFMAKAHTNAYRTIPYMWWPDAIQPRLRAIAGRTEANVSAAAQRYGYEGYYLSWEELVADPEIDLFDNCSGHHIHVEPTIAALQAGKHVLCEKPLALTAEDARRVRDAAIAAGAGVKHMTGFNYRFIPAIRFARDLIDQGMLGDLYHVRIQYLQQSIRDPDAPMRKVPPPEAMKAGSQAVLGCHAVDLARFLAGELATVSALQPRFVPERLGPDRTPIRMEWDDATLSLVEFANGAVGTIEASRAAAGRRNSLRLEINGSRGSIGFDLERLNELQVALADASTTALTGIAFQDVMVTEGTHPFMNVWWPAGHVVGWEHAHINEIHHLLRAIVDGGEVAPYGATLEDGYRAAVIADALERAATTGCKQEIAYD
ncbi:MAG TPA: Gfo/Idh/MocA family oxidoreductase [Thermomicrobiales bacterium]|nr:Gfo/Idh/MocA family oxidoreductase [Thermomicrobiales bacterium]